MLKARSRKLSLVLVLAMLMTMFAGLGTAQAAIVDYSAYGIPTVQTENDYTADLGKILVEIDDVTYLNDTDNWVTLKMPSGVSIRDAKTEGSAHPASVTIPDASVSDNIYAEVFFKNSSTVDIKVSPKAGGTAGKAKFTIEFNDVKVQSGSGNLDVTFIPQSGSILPGGTVTIANIVSKGATQATISSAKSLSDAGGGINPISIAELSPGALNQYNRDGSFAGGKIKLELPDGVEWANNGVVQGAWAFDGLAAGQVTATVDDNDRAILWVEIVNELQGSGKAGRLDIGGLAINIDEDGANKGEIVVKISSKDIDGVTKQDLVIAKYGDYETTITANEVTELVAGKKGQELGSFYIEESLAGSLVKGRTIVLELPSGVKWTEAPTLTVEKGSIEYDDPTPTAGKVRYTIRDFSSSAAKILVEDGEVYVEPDFEGDVEIEVDGTAGVEGTVKVAEAVKAVEVTASEVPNIIIGEQNVETGDIVIKETVAGAIQEGNIVIELAGGYEFYKEPDVDVTEGDLRIDDVDINSEEQLVITIDRDSDEASTITISGIYVTGYRYAPTGPVVAKFVAAEGNDENDDYTGSTAFDSLYRALDKTAAKDLKYSEKSVGEVAIANCITPAEASATAEFKIGSNIFYVNGAAKVMDVAPYIKGDRTYTPMRYVGEDVIGAEIVWDDAARTVTLTKNDTTVVFTIGSTAYTVNGEAMTADVAPEIANDRTMLPARYVAEAFGAIVGWDALTQTVLIQQ